MGIHAILGTDFSKAVAKIIDNSGIFKTICIEKISLVHVLNLRDAIMVEKFTIEGLEKDGDEMPGQNFYQYEQIMR